MVPEVVGPPVLPGVPALLACVRLGRSVAALAVGGEFRADVSAIALERFGTVGTLSLSILHGRDTNHSWWRSAALSFIENRLRRGLICAG